MAALAISLAHVDLAVILVAFGLATLVIAVAGSRLAGNADQLADRTGLGEAVVGAVLLGGSTSISGIVTSVTAAAQGHPQLSISNAIGGIAVQTAFLGIADISYRKANLEHAAASPANLTQGALLVTLLAIPLLAMSSPEVAVWGVHPGTIMLVAAYLFGLRLLSKARLEPMWRPQVTRETQQEGEEPEAARRISTVRLWGVFAFLAALVGASGYVVSQTAIEIAARTGFSETVIGGMMTAIATSLPELVTSVAAVRRGALTLAVGGIIGGNSFDTLFLAFSDIAYRDGSLYHELAPDNVLVISLTIVMTGVLLLGLLRRERVGFAGIGFESALVLVLYAGSVALLLA